MTKAFVRRLDCVIKVRVLVVDLCYKENAGNCIRLRIVPDNFRPNFNAFDGFNAHESDIGNTQRTNDIAGKIRVSWRIKDIDFGTLPVTMHNR